MPFYDAGDAAIYYEIEGQGTPLILLHGYALNGLMWEFQRAVLSKKYTLVIIDLRGFGKSSCGKCWSGAFMAEDIKGVIESLNLADVALLGFSMGGPVAVRLALDMPAIITRLILVSSTLPSSGRPKTESEIMLQERELAALEQRDIAGWIEAIGFRTGSLVGRMFDRNPAIAPLWDKIIERQHRDYLLCMMHGRLGTVSNIDWRSRLPMISQGTLVIAGAEDKRFLDASRHLAVTIPESKLAIIEGAGHMVNLEKPDEFNRAVSGFLSEH
jgi:pimeloyl-ACP methyl ester carboxylesterase